MAIKIAFSTVACPEWPLEKVAEQAEALGYDGVELRTLGSGGGELASDPALMDNSQVKDTLAAHGVKVACLSTSISLHPKGDTEIFQARQQTRDQIERAEAIGADSVRVFVNQIYPGEDRATSLRRVAETARPLVDEAADRGVRLLFENAGSFAAAKPWWWLMEMLDHPMAGILWNAANAAAADEADRGGAVSITALNSRIAMAKLKDTRVGEGVGFLPLGDGNVGVEKAVRRLLGIGFTGWISLEWDRVWLPSLAPAEEYLPEAIER
ncbi:MAG: sugar phosphate isomerase/epimerase family protein, partial [Phycisphaeraceae bacterium]|nr:sugar phosphate isomerase/epimerase family protein [Phycisphaeraceae bacterium]